MLTTPEVENIVSRTIELQEFKLTPPSKRLVEDTLEQGYNFLMETVPMDLRPMIWALGFLSCYQGADLKDMGDDMELGRYASDCCVLVLNRVLDGGC